MSQFHLIAPSGYCINQDAAQRGVQRLLESGHQVENQTIIPRRQQRFAGTEAQRLNDINSLVNLKGENRIVLAVRGGYGASRLLESIDWQGLALRQQQDPLLICGHSDFTVIQLGCWRCITSSPSAARCWPVTSARRSWMRSPWNISGARCVTHLQRGVARQWTALGM
jgi:muramoyltetrapeptide carboxypeptidase LdcA involved in peptidoglycan recycling